MRRFSAVLGLSLCAGAAAYLALAIRDAPALGGVFRQWGLVAALGILAIVQALRSIRPWAAAGPALLAVTAGLVYLNKAALQPPIATAIEALGVGLIGLVLVVAASGSAPSPRTASCKAILRGNRSRADHHLAPELHAVAIVGLADWDLATTSLQGPTDLNVTVVLGQVVLSSTDRLYVVHRQAGCGILASAAGTRASGGRRTTGQGSSRAGGATASAGARAIDRWLRTCHRIPTIHDQYRTHRFTACRGGRVIIGASVTWSGQGSPSR